LENTETHNYEIWRQETTNVTLVWFETYVANVNRLRVAHQCDLRADRRTHGQAGGSLTIAQPKDAR